MTTSLRALPDGPKGRVPEVRVAHKFLRGAHGSVVGLFESVAALNDARRAATGVNGGRMATHEVDIVRAAIAFTSSGLDASMQRLVWDAGRYLIPRAGTGARAQYESFIRQELVSSDKVGADLIKAIIASDPREELITYYLRQRTKASYQGSGDLDTRVRGALGLPGAGLPPARFKALDPFFTVRNSVVHKMDYQDVEAARGRARHHRPVEDAAAMCDLAFAVASDLIHSAATVIVTSR